MRKGKGICSSHKRSSPSLAPMKTSSKRPLAVRRSTPSCCCVYVSKDVCGWMGDVLKGGGGMGNNGEGQREREMKR